MLRSSLRFNQIYIDLSLISTRDLHSLNLNSLGAVMKIKQYFSVLISVVMSLVFPTSARIVVGSLEWHFNIQNPKNHSILIWNEQIHCSGFSVVIVTFHWNYFIPAEDEAVVLDGTAVSRPTYDRFATCRFQILMFKMVAASRQLSGCTWDVTSTKGTWGS